jgi:hypothetical protein
MGIFDQFIGPFLRLDHDCFVHKAFQRAPVEAEQGHRLDLAPAGDFDGLDQIWRVAACRYADQHVPRICEVLQLPGKDPVVAFVVAESREPRHIVRQGHDPDRKTAGALRRLAEVVDPMGRCRCASTIAGYVDRPAAVTDIPKDLNDALNSIKVEFLQRTTDTVDM